MDNKTVTLYSLQLMVCTLMLKHDPHTLNIILISLLQTTSIMVLLLEFHRGYELRKAKSAR